MSKWRKVKLSELGEVVGGATPSTKQDHYYNGSISWITPKDLAGYNNRYISKGERSITQEGLESCSAKILPKNSILFTSRAPIGYVAIADNELCTNQGFKSIIPSDNTDYMFLFYLLKHNKNKIESMGSGTTFKEVSGSVMKNIEVKVPDDYEEQRRIAAILSALDDKIELNNQINKNLEAQAQAIFKSWFVDFEPFKEDEFVESELGMIPRGWEVASFTKYLSTIGGGTPKTSNANFWNDQIPFFTPKDASYTYYSVKTEKNISSEGLRACSSRLFDIGTVFVTSRGTVGKVAIAGVPMAMNQSCYAVISEKYSQEFVHQLTLNTVERLKNKASGAVFDAIVTRDFDAEVSILPPEEVANIFTNTIKPIYRSILLNAQQSQTLAAIRDSLLPKLMNGEINVPLEA